MAFDELRLLQQAGAGFDPGQDPESARDLAEERERSDRSVRLAEDAEQLALADRQAGGPLGELPRAQAKLNNCLDEEADLKEQLRKAEARTASARSSVRFWADRLLIVEESVSRSRVPDPMEEASARAADAMRRHREGQMVVERAKREQRAWWSR